MDIFWNYTLCYELLQTSADYHCKRNFLSSVFFCTYFDFSITLALHKFYTELIFEMHYSPFH